MVTRRTLGIIGSAGALVAAAVLGFAGIVLSGNATFAEDYVGDQLSREKIEFAAVEDLTPQDKAYSRARTGCLFTYAEQQVTTGKQAECFANEYIGSHLTYLATRLGKTNIAYLDGLTYREMGLALADLNAEIAAAEEARDPVLADLELELADATYVRTKAFEGSMLRNALLTSYGFSVLGEKAAQAMAGAFIAAGVFGLIGLGGFAFLFVTRPKKQIFERPDRKPAEPVRKEKELVGV